MAEVEFPPFPRIKGANSDYRYDLSKNQIVQEGGLENKKVYLKIFVCPYGMPSRVEPHEGESCEGIDAECPHGKQSPGHALISLDQEEGIKLIAANNNQLIVDQKGSIQLCAAKQVEVKGNLVTHSPVEVNNTLIVKQKNGKNVILEISEKSITMQVVGGAKISINESGNIELSPSGNSGKVIVNGDLDVKGKWTGKLSEDLKQSLIQEIRQSLGK
jgi:carbon monoxide dehydrogenase subunit G